ncbi:MAG: polymorphic toxin-type HINT domain-containing protein [Bacteroidota bacterium]|nr:polymorphic toxin-type HINT domain-containing protein [Bacteroidota bacterium]
MVWTEDSLVEIQHLKAGDKVNTFNVETGNINLKPVLTAYEREVNKLVKIDFENETVYTTLEHPFFINNTWLEAGKLKEGDALFLYDKTTSSVLKISVIDTVVKVYNITVDTDHDYFVTGKKVLVHNVDCKPYTISQVKEALKKVHAEVGELPKGPNGKWGSPQRGTSKKGYRLDSEGHPNATDPAEMGPHINYWDYTKGKRGSGGKSGAIPIE